MDSGQLLNYALRVMGARGHSISELRRKLEQKAERPEDVPDVLSKLKQYGYLNDRKFADAYAASRLESQGFGKTRVLRDLAQRRVPPAVAKQAVESAFQGKDEAELIEAFLSRKLRNKNLREFLSVEKNLANVYRRLRHAGFGAGVSVRVLKRYAASAERLEGTEEPEAPEG